MGTVEELRGVKQPLLLASTTQAARRDGNVIIHVAQGTTHIGPAKSYEEGLQLSRGSPAKRTAGCRLAQPYLLGHLAQAGGKLRH